MNKAIRLQIACLVLTSSTFGCDESDAFEGASVELLGSDKDGDASPLAPTDRLGLSAGEPLVLSANAKSNIIFLNFDGVDLLTKDPNDLNDDPVQGKVWASYHAGGPYLPYGNGPKRAAVLQAVKAHWAAYDVLITDVRPVTGPYTMVIVSPSNFADQSMYPQVDWPGLAARECDDNGKNNAAISTAYFSEDDAVTADTQARWITRGAAITLGLGPSEDPADIMTRPNPGPGFIDGCAPVGNNPGCAGTHGQIAADACGNNYFQQAHHYLLWLFGPAPDVTPPVVAITSPGQGQTFLVGTDLVIAAEATDAVGVVNTRLYLNGGLFAEGPAAPYAWTIPALPAATYTVTVDAVDAAGNLGVSAPITIAVVDESLDPSGATTDDADTTSGPNPSGSTSSGPNPSGSTSADDADGSGATVPTGSDGDPDADSLTDGASSAATLDSSGDADGDAGQDDKGGSGCSVRGGRGGGGLTLAILVFAGLLRRRRASVAS